MSKKSLSFSILSRTLLGAKGEQWKTYIYYAYGTCKRQVRTIDAFGSHHLTSHNEERQPELSRKYDSGERLFLWFTLEHLFTRVKGLMVATYLQKGDEEGGGGGSSDSTGNAISEGLDGDELSPNGRNMFLPL